MAKIAISIPDRDFEEVERIRKIMGLSRSALIDKAIRFWLKERKKRKMIKQYEEGYRSQQESIDEISAIEEASAEAFHEEGWE